MNHNRTFILRAILFYALLASSVTAIGQTNKYRFGFIAGGTADKFWAEAMTGSSEYSVNPKIGYHFGLCGNYQFKKKLSLRSGLIHQTRKMVYSYNYRFGNPNDPLIPNRTELQLSDLSIPLWFLYTIDKRPKAQIKLYAGGVYSFVYKSSETTISETALEKESSFYTSDLKKNQMLVDVGFSLELNTVGPTLWSINPFVRKGLSPLNENQFSTGVLSIGCTLAVFI